MRNYRKTCLNCGNVFTAHRIDKKTCSESCRTKLYYKRKYGNQPIKTFDTSFNKSTALGVETFQQKETFSNKCENVLADSYLYDITTEVKREINVLTEIGPENYFVINEQEKDIEYLKYCGTTYKRAGFFWVMDGDFNTFHRDMASNFSDFIFLEIVLASTVHLNISNVIEIYVNVDLFDDFIEDKNLYETYKFTSYYVGESH